LLVLCVRGRRWTQGRDAIGTDGLDQQPAAQQRCEGPAKPDVLRRQPWAVPVTVGDPCDMKIGRKETAPVLKDGARHQAPTPSARPVPPRRAGQAPSATP